MKEIKELIKFGLDFTEGVAHSMEDGKIGLTDLANFIEPLKTIIPALTGMDVAINELKKMTDEQRLELFAYIKDEFDLPNDELEEKIEESISFILSFLNLVSMFRK